MRDRLGKLDLKASPYLYIAPFFIIFGIFGAYPMFRTLYMSFFDWDLANARFDPPVYIGLDNYAKMLDDPYYWNALKNTIGVFLLAMTKRARPAGAFIGLLAGMIAVGSVSFGAPGVSFLWHNVIGAVTVLVVGMAISLASRDRQGPDHARPIP